MITCEYNLQFCISITSNRNQNRSDFWLRLLIFQIHAFRWRLLVIELPGIFITIIVNETFVSFFLKYVCQRRRLAQVKEACDKILHGRGKSRITSQICCLLKLLLSAGEKKLFFCRFCLTILALTPRTSVVF